MADDGGAAARFDRERVVEGGLEGNAEATSMTALDDAIVPWAKSFSPAGVHLPTTYVGLLVLVTGSEAVGYLSAFLGGSANCQLRVPDHRQIRTKPTKVDFRANELWRYVRTRPFSSEKSSIEKIQILLLRPVSVARAAQDCPEEAGAKCKSGRPV